jgi:hypothetical protein
VDSTTTPAIHRATTQGSKGVRDSWRLARKSWGTGVVVARGVAAGKGTGKRAGVTGIAGACTREAVKVSMGSARSTIRNRQLTA